MKDMIKRVIAVAMVCVMVLGVAALAAEQASNYISYKGGGIAPTGNGNMRISFDVVATGMMDELGAHAVHIYSEDGSPEHSIYYTDPGCSDMMTTNDYSWDGEVTWEGVSGESYYAIIVFYAEDSTGSDTRTYITSTVRV